MRSWLAVLVALRTSVAFAEEATGAPSVASVREQMAAEEDDEEEIIQSYVPGEEEEGDEDWGDEQPTGDPTMVLQAKELLKEAKEKYDEKEAELFKEPKELVRRAKNAMSWGAVNASLEMFGRAVALAGNETNDAGFEIRREFASQLAVVMYYKDMTADGVGLLKSLVSDMDFENVTSVQVEAERVIWLGASHMRNNGGEMRADDDFELLKSLAGPHTLGCFTGTSIFACCRQSTCVSRNTYAPVERPSKRDVRPF